MIAFAAFPARLRLGINVRYYYSFKICNTCGIAYLFMYNPEFGVLPFQLSMVKNDE
jgi:hypothetical protein